MRFKRSQGGFRIFHFASSEVVKTFAGFVDQQQVNALARLLDPCSERHSGLRLVNAHRLVRVATNDRTPHKKPLG